MAVSKRVFRLAGWRRAKLGLASDRYSLPAVYGLAGWSVYAMAVVEGEIMAMSRLRSAQASPGPVWVDEVFMTEYPALFEFLSETLWDDGKKRETGTLILAVEGRSVKAKVCDRDGKRGAWLTAETMQDLFRRIDQALSNDNLDWRRETR